MSTIIKLRCLDQVLTFESTPVIASGGLEEDFIQVEFCSKWDGMIRTAVFWRSEKDVYHVMLDENDTCAIPKEVLTDDGTLYFGLFGVSADGRQRTSEAMRYTIQKGAITSGTKPPDPTPDIYTDLIAKYNEMIAIAADTRAKEQAFEAAMTAAQQAFEQALTEAVNKDQAAFEQAMTAAQSTFEQHIQQMIADGLLPDDSVTTVKLKDGVVTTAKIADKAITAEKVADGLLVDAYNKTETLTTATKALFGLGASAVPNEVFTALANFKNNFGSMYLWEKLTREKSFSISDSGTATVYCTGTTTGTSGKTVVTTREFYPSYEVGLDGSLKLTGTPKTLSGSYNSPPSSLSSVVGYYTSDSPDSDATTRTERLEAVYQVQSSSTTAKTQLNSTYCWYMNSLKKITVSNFALNVQSHGYVCDSNPNAYPINDGYDYVPMGRFGEKIRISMGSYTGIGKSGLASYACKLTFDFEPKIVFLHEGKVLASNNMPMYYILYRNATQFPAPNGGATNLLTWGGPTVSWYTTSTTPAYQFNAAGTEYYYIAIG